MIIYLMRHGLAERPVPGQEDATRRLTEQLFDATRPVEQGILSVQVKVDELRHRYSHSIVDGGFDEMS